MSNKGNFLTHLFEYKKARCLSSGFNHMKNHIFLLKEIIYSNTHLKTKMYLINQTDLLISLKIVHA